MLDKKRNVDILIIAEGTYPYVRGGVSSWIDQIINGMPQYSFGILFLGSKKNDYEKKNYKFAKNVHFFDEYFLFDDIKADEPKAIEIKREDFEKLKEFHKKIKNKVSFDFKTMFNARFFEKEITINDFLYSRQSWEFIKENYNKNCGEISFIDYFWTLRSIHKPIWLLAKIASMSNMAKVVHSPSTGYAGFTAALISSFHNIPFILTEHGIYIRERKMDMHANSGFMLYKSSLQKSIGSCNYLKKMWIDFFEKIGFLTYQSADDILSLYNGAKELQIEFGANRNRCRVIPNGVDTKKLNKLVEKRVNKNHKVITLLGRVVSIKDIKTFIRSIRIVADKFPDIQGWIAGPLDEDVVYANECRRMVETLNLEKNIKFLGFQKIDDILPKTDILTLTSISEGMPLVILEGFAAGVPCVSTDVGSCSELIYGGLNQEDINIGKAGEIVPVANPSKLAQAYMKLLDDEELWRLYRQNALKRVNRFYTQQIFFDKYIEVYEKALSRWRG